MKKHFKTTSVAKPEAYIVNSNDRGRKSIKGDKIYLENGQEFEIEIFNPLKESILADIRLNSQSISKNGLVIKPGQRIYLDCFIDDKKKFIFETYQVESSEESIEAIQNNGLLEIFFYKEEAVTLKDWPDQFRGIVIKEFYPVYIDRYPRWYNPFWTYYSGPGTVRVGGTTFNTSTTVSSFNNSGVSFGGTTVNNVSTYTNSIGSFNAGSTFTTQNYSSNPIETGRVEKGADSNQQFDSVWMNFEQNYIHSIVYQLLPNSRKPAEVKDISKTKKIKEKLRIGTESAELLVKLKALLDSGILTQSEFDQKKRDILSRI